LILISDVTSHIAMHDSVYRVTQLFMHLKWQKRHHTFVL